MLSQNDPDPGARRAGPPAWRIVAIAAVVLVIVALHLTGVVGPG